MLAPLTLSYLSTWLKAIGPDADNLNVLFISIDPERDTSAHLKKYLSSFDPRIRGTTGTGEQIAAVAKEYRFYCSRIQLEGGVYALPHAAVIYLMDRAGKFVNQISLQKDDDKIAIERLRQLPALSVASNLPFDAWNSISARLTTRKPLIGSLGGIPQSLKAHPRHAIAVLA